MSSAYEISMYLFPTYYALYNTSYNLYTSVKAEKYNIRKRKAKGIVTKVRIWGHETAT